MQQIEGSGAYLREHKFYPKKCIDELEAVGIIGALANKAEKASMERWFAMRLLPSWLTLLACTCMSCPRLPIHLSLVSAGLRKGREGHICSSQIIRADLMNHAQHHQQHLQAT